MVSAEKRRAARVIPIMTDEEVVLVHIPSGTALAKVIDISMVGVLAYLVHSVTKVDPEAVRKVSFYHKGNVIDVNARITRKDGRLIALDFVNVTPRKRAQIQAKLDGLQAMFMKAGGR